MTSAAAAPSPNRRIAEGVAATAGYVASIYTANWMVATFHFVWVFPGLTAPAGVYAAGVCLMLRNVVQDRFGRRVVLAAIVLGALLSWAWSSPQLAVASGATFLAAELCDMTVYTPMRSRTGWARAVLSGNGVGALVDSLLFLYLAGFLTWGNLIGQVVGKYLWATLLFVASVSIYREVRQRRRAVTV